ncbi:hypothetical protein XFF6992_450040 [Xanthomonas citri pv. fuscans]|nr:hypothetical protein XFF6992_450040 [Xanthomonas citri pv. fuscans]
MLHAQTYCEVVDAATLIPRVLYAFIAGDRGSKACCTSDDRVK